MVQGWGELTGNDDLTRAAWANARRPQPTRGYRCLLDLDSDLADELDPQARVQARTSITAMTFGLGGGGLELQPWLSTAAPGPGLVLLEGVVAVFTRTFDRVAAELLGAGDLIQPPGHDEEQFVLAEVAWRGLMPSRYAVLDAAFVERVRPWPQVMQALLRRAERRTRNLGVQRAIASQPRLEVRLTLLLWHLAARWGRIEPGGVRLPVPLTHQLLGRLVGAERPSVSNALARLANAGLISGHGDEWHLYGTIGDHLATMIEPTAARVQRLVTPQRPRS